MPIGRFPPTPLAEVLVRLRFTPRDDSFFEHFRSAGANLQAGTEILQGMLTSSDDRELGASRMRDAEHANDEVTHAVMRHLNATFVTPFDREDIYRLASRLDDVMDAMEAAADLIVLYDLAELPREMALFGDLLVRCADVTAQAMGRMRGLKDLEPYWIEVNRLENQADGVYRRLLAKLFSGEYEALTVLKLKEVLDQLEEAADAFEHVADTVETIVVKDS
jgi:predicted phosphate transport protein (TIGR00153 family)